ncbi:MULTISPECIES: tautomerase family protein [Amycolatopsis]|uniref:Tautomerase family protein n=1 Tax=Amycolatopsis thermalba TaxID=944492 RepID=A0ABY4P1J2_9PSEU|nr:MULTISPECIES: tautomerase family protein [Amycolatopsis]OXM61314.1 tautomerase family protein [Amycolatopsis sp. KNN50.9b]UQS26148.1 tautomerase family protein [Amycolatopsis thermalba]
MPLVRIDALPTHDDATLAALGDAVHQAMTETIDVPADDLFQVISTGGLLRYGTYPGIRRDDGVVFVSITMRVGRTDAQKKALYARIAELAAERAGIEPRNVFVSVTENHPVDWSMGEGVAQYLK